MDQKMRLFKDWVRESGSIVFFGGAGVSTESGIPDFRSTNGLYRQQYDYPPEEILSHTFFMKRPEEFFQFYRAKMLCLTAKPNAAHRKLAQWEREGKLKAVVTQNIDGLHQAAGSKQVYELHGSVLRNTCMRCGKFYEVKAIRKAMAFHAACAAGSLSRTLCSMKRGWISGRWKELPVPLPMLIFSSWAELRSRFIPLRDWCVTMPETD